MGTIEVLRLYCQLTTFCCRSEALLRATIEADFLECGMFFILLRL